MQNPNSVPIIAGEQRMEVIERYQILDTPRLAIEAANVGTWIIDKETRVLITSSRVKELFGYQPEQELSYETMLSQISDKHRDKAVLGIEEAFRIGKPYHQDFSITSINNRQVRWIKAVGGLYHDPEATLSHISGVMMDITEQKQQELRKNKLIGIVSHELKTPLTSLKAYVQMLHAWAKKKKDSFTVSALDKMEKQVKKMGNMINGFLSLSQVESGKIRLNLKEFNLNELITDAIEETLLLYPDYTLNFSPVEPLILQADQDKIDQVIINFLSNAVKYSPKQGAIEIASRIVNGMAELSVKDHGLGIARDDINKLFERYYRVENQHTQNIPGFGIGLYLCSEIINHHHGKIWVESEPGKGSTFFFRVPLKAQLPK